MPMPSKTEKYQFKLSSSSFDRREGSMILLWALNAAQESVVKICYYTDGSWYTSESNTTVIETVDGNSVNYVASAYFEGSSIARAAFLPPPI